MDTPMPQPPSLAKPLGLLDRDREWARLAEAARSPKPPARRSRPLAEAARSPGPDLGLGLGRRRAGKSYLLTRFV